MATVSVVVPLYRCSDNILELARRLHVVMHGLHTSYELIFIDDGSPDDEWKKILTCVNKYPEVIGITLKHNVGQQTAIAVGLSKSQGEWTVVMDGDLQDRPEDAPILLAAAKKNNSVVIARRTFRRFHLFYLLLLHIYHLIISLISKKASDVSLGNFSVLDKKTRSTLQKTNLVCLSYLQAVRRIASTVSFVDVVHDDRLSGMSSYTLTKLVRLALVTFSCWMRPIRYSNRAVSYDFCIKEIQKQGK